MESKSEKNAKHYLIVGGGIAGVSTAETIAKNEPGAKITIICEEACLPYFRINLTMYLSGSMEAERLTMHPADWYTERNIKLLLDTVATRVDPQKQTVQLHDGSELAYDTLILANGASPFVPPIKGVELEGVKTLRTIEDADAILTASQHAAKVVCIGGGLLGLEVASAIAESGGEVVVLEAQPWLLPRQLDKHASQHLQKRIEAQNVRVLLNVQTEAILGESRVEKVLLSDGRELPADLVVISAGVRPNLDLARSAGVKTNRGALVDRAMRTSVENILAVGDLCECNGYVYGQWIPANAQGKIAGLTAVGKEATFEDWSPAALLKLMGFNLFSIGKITPTEPDEFVIADERDGNYYSFLLGQGKILGAILIGDTKLSRDIKLSLESKRDYSNMLSADTSLDTLLALLA